MGMKIDLIIYEIICSSVRTHWSRVSTDVVLNWEPDIEEYDDRVIVMVEVSDDVIEAADRYLRVPWTNSNSESMKIYTASGKPMKYNFYTLELDIENRKIK